ncbi:MAG TPA: ABC transporter permease [Bryobacteraceae bacterium]|nr:ABC transporter permease [Bryobacteraceae bacterium]
MFRFRFPRRRRPADPEIDEELQYHLEMLSRERAESGAAPEDAQAFARRRLGNRTAIQEVTRETWRSGFMDAVARDVRHAVRMLRRAPAFYLLVIVILALGIAAAVSVFSLADGVLLRPLPYREPQRLVMLTSYAPKPPFEANGSMSYNDFRQLQAKATSFADLVVTFRTGWSRVTLLGGPEPLTLQGAFVSPNLFTMCARSPLIGRVFTSEENQRAEQVVVIGEALWARQFGSSPGAIGQELHFSGRGWKIIGVMPNDFQVPFLQTQVWAPILCHPDPNPFREENPLDQARWDVMARLRSTVSLPAAQAEVDSIENGLRAALPDLHTNRVRLVPLREHFSGSARRPLFILLCSVGSLLLIALANVANLLLARASQRDHELAIRAALGAGRSQLIRSVLTEVLTLSALAGLAGIAGACALVPLLRAVAPASTPLLDSVAMDYRALVFAVLISTCSGLLLGIAGAWRFAQSEPGDALKAGGRNATETRRSGRLKRTLVIGEFAIATVLLTAAGLLIRSFIGVLGVDPGFHPDRVLTVKVGLPDKTTGEQAARFYRDAFERIGSLPGVEAAGGVSNLFFLDEKRTHALRQVEGHPPEPALAWTPLVWTQVSGEYFRAMGIPLLKGRFFNAADNPASPPVAIVNETLARRYWPHEDPVGKRLKGFDPRGQHDDWLTVVGLVKDTRSGGLEKPPFSQIYEVQAQRGDQTGNLVVRTAADPKGLAASIRGLLRSLNRNAMVASISTMEQVLDVQRAGRRFQTWLVSVFSGLALLLAALGVFAIMHYSVAARTGEIGIRMALGADSRTIALLVLKDGARLALLGILIGTLGALWSANAIAGMLYLVKPADPVAFGAAALTLVLVALLASYLPALRAAHVDPMVALRSE